MKYLVRLIVTAVLFLSGCATNLIEPYSGSLQLDENKAVIVGYISEGFLFQPHDLRLYLDSASIEPARILIRTLYNGQEDESPESNIRGHHFMYEVPAGEYRFSKWSYYHYEGSSPELIIPINFEVNSGDVVYIGNIHGVSLNYCLSNGDKFDTESELIKDKFPVLENKEIINKARTLAFSRWGHTKSNTTFGSSKVCRQPYMSNL